MSDRILIVYATRTGSTEEIAKEIARILVEKGRTVDILPARRAKNLSPYKAVIIGSAVRAAQWLPEAARFVETYKSQLQDIPTAFFTVSLTLSDYTDSNLKRVASFVDPVRQLLKPDIEGFFAGRMDPKRLSPLPRLMAKAMKTREGDFRNWDAIRSWAEEADKKLSS